LPFVLIGDSGERDPEIYGQVVHDHPNRVRVIYIRSVNPDPARIEAIDRLIDEVRPTGVQLVLAPDSEFAAAHAAAEGLISAAGLAAVRSQKRQEQPALTVQA
jgi:phosphatidate phosphatase APP1